MKTSYIITISIVLLVAFLVWVNWPEKKAINPAWQMDYDANIKAGYTEAEATKRADSVYPKYVAA